MTIKETPRALACGRGTAYNLIKRGELDMVKLGSATRITVATVKKLVDGVAK